MLFDFSPQANLVNLISLSSFYTDFEINIVVVMKDDNLVSENFPLAIYRN